MNDDFTRHFIGREDELAFLRENFFVSSPGSGFCGAVNGPNDIGKTWLIRKAAQEFEAREHPNVYYFKTSIIAESSYWNFWSLLIQDFAERIPPETLRAAPHPEARYIKQIEDAYTFFTDMENLNQIGTNGFHSFATRHLNKLFRAFTGLGIHILITIDEFDNARTAFPADSGDGSFFQRLYMLSPKSGNGYSLSILLVSRRRISTIAHHMADGSDIESAFPPAIVLRGFSDREMEDYFASYQDLPCGLPTEEQRQQIYYFCGRHPGQLMKMRDLFARYYDGTRPLVPSELYHDHGQEMTTLYDRMNRLLRTEYVDQANKRNCVGTFSQVFIGPAYDANLTNYLEQLYKYGLLTKWDKQGKNVFQLSGLIYEDTSEQRFDYEPMSPYYVEFFKAKVIPEELDGLNRLMNVAEQSVRDGILKVLKSNIPNGWEAALEGFTNSSKSAYRVKLDLLAYQNDADMRNITYTNLDVFSYTDYSKIIRHYWDTMRPYFRSFRTKEELANAFDFLKDGRNCFAHNNARILDPQSCSRLRELCTTLIQDHEQGEQNVPLPSPAPAGAPLASAAAAAGLAGAAVSVQPGQAAPVMPTFPQIQEMLNRPGTVTFCFQEKKRPRGNLRGILKGSRFPAGISKANLADFGADFEPQPGDEFQAVITQWDANAGIFVLVAPPV